jgi:aldose 1-epimerase
MIELFGTLRDGRKVEAVTLGAPSDLQAQVLTYGGSLRRLMFPARGGQHELVVTLPDLDAYVSDTTYQGVLVGRVANRIAGARFELNGRSHPLTANDGPNLLHGGRQGFGKRIWRVLDVQGSPPSRLWLGLHSADGEEGFPGALDVTVEMALEAAQLRVSFEARGSEPTPVNLTFHPYFNLSGDTGRAVDEMTLRIPAASYLAVGDAQLIPTGEIASVGGTPFDFRSPRTVGSPPLSTHPQLAHGGGYDHCWVLDSERDFDAELYSPRSGITMTVRSDRPGLQFYGGQHLRGAHAGVNGVCLEPQDFPNAVNEPAFPSCILEAGETRRSTFAYRFGESR